MEKYVLRGILTLALVTGVLACIHSQCKKCDTITIAMAQIFCLDGDREGNFARIEHAIQDAKVLNADLITFPETAILGWVNPEAHERAFPIPGRDSGRLCRLARQYDIYLSIGLAETDGDDLYDAALLIDNAGNILLKHRKINILEELMSPAYTTGSEVNAVETSLGRIGLLICADCFREEITNRMKAFKPDLVLIPYDWAADEEEWPEHGKSLAGWVKHSSKTFACPVIGTDLVGEITHGPWTGKVYGGQSVAADKNGVVLATGKDRDRDILIVRIEKPI